MKITNICIGTSQKNVYKISHLHDIFLLDYCNWFFLNAFYFATLRGEKHGSCHIWTLGFLRSPKHNKILEDVYFSITKFGSFLLWMVAIVAKITKLKEKKKKKHTHTLIRAMKHFIDFRTQCSNFHEFCFKVHPFYLSIPKNGLNQRVVIQHQTNFHKSFFNIHTYFLLHKIYNIFIFGNSKICFNIVKIWKWQFPFE